MFSLLLFFKIHTNFFVQHLEEEKTPQPYGRSKCNWFSVLIRTYPIKFVDIPNTRKNLSNICRISLLLGTEPPLVLCVCHVQNKNLLKILADCRIWFTTQEGKPGLNNTPFTTSLKSVPWPPDGICPIG